MSSSDNRKLKVLIVENDLCVRKILRATIDECIPDTIIHQAGNGKQAIAVIKNENPDIVFLDTNIHKLCKNEISFEIRSLKSSDNIPIIVIYGEANSISPDWNIGEVVDDFVLKPMSLETMKGILEKWTYIKMFGI